MEKLNRVIIVGRTNIGKSTLFNRISSSVKSIIFEQEGVTRDYIKDVVRWKGTDFELIDSAGLSFKKSQDPLLEKVRLSALELFEKSQLIVFVVDGTTGVLPEDQQIAKAVHKSGKKALLVINKADRKETQEHSHEFDRLGFKNPVIISAQHGTGVDDLLTLIIQELEDCKPEVSVVEKPQFKVVLLGKPNVGKSSLMNALLNEQRSLVTDIPGTTREAIHESVEFDHEIIELIDTPGVRRPRSIEEDLEQLMVKSALSAVRQSNIVMLLFDSSQGKVSNQELKLAFYAFEKEHKALILLFNKSDLMNAQLRADLDHSLEEYQTLMHKVVSINISVKNKKNVDKILPTIQQVWEHYSQEFSEEELTSLFKQALIKTPLYRNGKILKLYYAKQIKSAPIVISLLVNEPIWFVESSLAFFENKLREEYDLKGVPVQFTLKKAGEDYI